MKRILILILTVSTIISCSKEKSNSPFGLEIRLSNNSQYNFKNVIINTGTGEVNFGNLNARKQTEYRKFSNAYRYAFVKVEINGKTYMIQPIDYVGALPLSDGRYTYQLSVNGNQDQYSNLNLQLIED